MRSNLIVIVGLGLIPLTGGAVAGAEARLGKTIGLLTAGREPVRIVCFGDSITGVYYHTGGRRAWCDMLGIALQRIYPKAKLQMVNAGISGHTTAKGLERIERDVLAKKPHLVVVMFGMNDVVGVPRATFAENLRTIVRRCRGVGAEVMLCTPNSIYPEDARRPVERLAAFAEMVRVVAGEMAVPLVDCYAAYEATRAKDRRAWMLLMSETIHPNMNGHKAFAEQIAFVLSGKRVALGDVRPLEPSIPHTLALLSQDKPIKLIAMAPYDRIVARVLAELNPKSKIDLVRWPTQGKSLADLERWAKGVRDQNPNLVVVAVPPDLVAANVEAFIRSYSWVLNWSMSFGRSAWDVVAVLPSVTDRGLSARHQATADLARRVVIGQDIGFIERAAGETDSPEQVVRRWFRATVRPTSLRPGRPGAQSRSLRAR